MQCFTLMPLITNYWAIHKQVLKFYWFIWPGTMCGQKATHRQTLPNGAQPPPPTGYNGKQTLSLTSWWGGIALSTTAASLGSAGTKWLTSWSWTHRWHNHMQLHTVAFTASHTFNVVLLDRCTVCKSKLSLSSLYTLIFDSYLGHVLPHIVYNIR